MHARTWFWPSAAAVFLAGFLIGSHTHGTGGRLLAFSRPSELAGSQTLYEYLIQFAPERADEVAEAMAARGLALDSPAKADLVPPWSEVVGRVEEAFFQPGDAESQIRQRVGWFGGKLTDEMDFRAPEVNTRGLALSDSNVSTLREVSHKYEGALLELAEVERVELEQALREKWRAGSLFKMPILDLPPPTRPGKRTLGARSVVIGAWHASVTVYEGEAPAYEKAMRELDSVRRSRADAMREVLARL
jgi:hypothetical protein